MNKKLGFGIIGGGMISQYHAKAISSLEDVRIVAVADPVREKAEMLSLEYGCIAYEDYMEMLKRPDIDIINICTPSALHSEQCINAAMAGKHVIVEKPIDIDLKAADRMIKACRDAGVKMTCIFQRRYEDSIVKLKKAVEEGKLGQLNFGACYTKWYRTQKYYDSGAWRGTWKFDGGGALMNQSIHYIDLLHYIMGPVDEVFGYCATRAHNIEVEDVAVASVKFKNGAVGSIEGTTAAFPGFSTRLDIYGSDGSVIIEDQEIVEWKLKCEGIEVYDDYGGAKSSTAAIQVKAEAGDDTGTNKPLPSGHIDYKGHAKQMKVFIDAIRNNIEPPVGPEEGRYTLAIIKAIYESARTGKPVKVE